MTLFIQLKEFTFQIIPDKDLCYILKNGVPMWAGDKDGLIKLLKEVNEA